MKKITVIRIVAPHFVAGICKNNINNKLTKTAPILKYMKNWSLFEIAIYCKQKQWKLSIIN